MGWHTLCWIRLNNMLNRCVEHTCWTYCRLRLVPHFYHWHTLKQRTTRKEDQLGGLQLFGHLAVATTVSNISGYLWMFQAWTLKPPRTFRFLETSWNILQHLATIALFCIEICPGETHLRCELLWWNVAQTSIALSEQNHFDKSIHQHKWLLQRFAKQRGSKRFLVAKYISCNCLGNCRTPASSCSIISIKPYKIYDYHTRVMGINAGEPFWFFLRQLLTSLPPLCTLALKWSSCHLQNTHHLFLFKTQ